MTTPPQHPHLPWPDSDLAGQSQFLPRKHRERSGPQSFAGCRLPPTTYIVIPSFACPIVVLVTSLPIVKITSKNLFLSLILESNCDISPFVLGQYSLLLSAPSSRAHTQETAGKKLCLWENASAVTLFRIHQLDPIALAASITVSQSYHFLVSSHCKPVNLKDLSSLFEISHTHNTSLRQAQRTRSDQIAAQLPEPSAHPIDT